MKISNNVASELLTQAELQLRALLAPLPVQPMRFIREHGGIDLMVGLGVGTQHRTLACEVISNGQPRFIRAAALQARDFAQRATKSKPAYPMVIAPFISLESGAICRELGVGYADLAGNCRLAFDSVYIEKSVATNPFKEKREQRSLFAPKSARVLRIMLGEPSRDWKVAELAAHAGISYGQISKLRKHLLDHEWASGQWGGVRISKPQALLDAWKRAYAPMRTSRNRYYTLLHGEQLNSAIRDVSSQTTAGSPVILNSFSAARWLAPYARVAGEYFYADREGEARLKVMLKLEPATKGENISIDLASDEGVFQDAVEVGSGYRCTGLIQTYLDLAAAGERGAESAQHLFDLCIAPKWTASA
jgi:hypothetical protein